MKIILPVAACVSLLVSAVVMQIALEHNPQEAYCVYASSTSACSIDWTQLLTLGGAWFGAVFIVSTAGGWVVVRMLKRGG